jgi:hypothetical protein
VVSESSNAIWWCAGINALAVLVAPAIALWAQRRSDRSKAAQDRKQEIFKTLWTNRRRPFYIARVDALNMIDVEFYRNKAVRDAWLDLFANYRDKHPGLNDEQIAQQREELFTTLLFEISKVLGYELGRAEIRDNVYRPELHNTFDTIEFETRKRVLDLLKSDALPIRFVETPRTTAEEAHEKEAAAQSP